MQQSVRWKHVWITGASTGIGKALAIELAAHGSKVSITARSEEKLEEMVRLNAGISAYPADVVDSASLESVVIKSEREHGPIDLAVLNAGIWTPSGATLELSDFVHSMTVNYDGVVGALAPVIRSMQDRRAGHVAIVASVAGYRGLPKGAYYGPTKAALINMCESLRPQLQQNGIKLQVINPGFIRTPMTDRNTFPMPFLLETDDAVRRLIAGLESNRFEIAFPWQLVWILKIAQLLPYPLFFWFVRTFIAGK